MLLVSMSATRIASVDELCFFCEIKCWLSRACCDSPRVNLKSTVYIKSTRSSLIRSMYVGGSVFFFFFSPVNLIISEKNNLPKINILHALRLHICYYETDFLSTQKNETDLFL